VKLSAVFFIYMLLCAYSVCGCNSVSWVWS